MSFFFALLGYLSYTNEHSSLSGFALFSREVPLKDAKEYAESIGAVVVETSAKNAINIEELFQGISKYLICVFRMACIFMLWESEDKNQGAPEESTSSV